MRSGLTRSAIPGHGDSGTRTVFIARNCNEQRCHGLKGFAFERARVGPGSQPRWLHAGKAFSRSFWTRGAPGTGRTRPNPRASTRMSFRFKASSGVATRLTLTPSTATASCRCTVSPANSRPIREMRSSSWFAPRSNSLAAMVCGLNRGAIASQRYAKEFGNQPPQEDWRGRGDTWRRDRASLSLTHGTGGAVS